VGRGRADPCCSSDRAQTTTSAPLVAVVTSYRGVRRRVAEGRPIGEADPAAHMASVRSGIRLSVASSRSGSSRLHVAEIVKPTATETRASTLHTSTIELMRGRRRLSSRGRNSARRGRVFVGSRPTLCTSSARAGFLGGFVRTAASAAAAARRGAPRDRRPRTIEPQHPGSDDLDQSGGA